MPVLLFVVKKIPAFWLCYIAGLLSAEMIVILLLFFFGKNMLVWDVFDTQTITLITCYGYIVVIGVTLFYLMVLLFIGRRLVSGFCSFDGTAHAVRTFYAGIHPHFHANTSHIVILLATVTIF